MREGVQCVCMASGNPEPTIEFFLPDLNVTINETDGQYNFFSHTDGHTTTGMIKLREKGERADNGPAVNVHCSIFNMYGRESVQLELQQESESFLLQLKRKRLSSFSSFFYGYVSNTCKGLNYSRNGFTKPEVLATNIKIIEQ